MAHPPRAHEDYQIGVICALAIEKAAIVAMLDDIHPKLKKEKGDDNEYTLGRIGIHDIVIACLPAGLMGNGPAATVANNMQRSFPIKFGLMIGVAGGVWSKKDDIRLGDVVVSQPKGTHGGVVQWDFGKMEKGGKFQRTGALDKPPPVLLSALQELKVFDEMDGIDLQESLSLMIRNKPRMAEKYRHQGIENDILFEATYDHEGDEMCDGCDAKSVIKRSDRNDLTPRIHYGNIASGNELMKHGTTRDKIAKEEGVICFEMEAAGLMDNFRCLVIRGICDYADSHKNKIWQQYAAATAAAFARALLSFIDKQEVIEMSPPPKPLRVLPFGRNKDFVGRQPQLDRLIAILYSEDTEEDCQRAALVGLGGVGKTQIALEFAFRLQSISPIHSVFWVRASDTSSFDGAYRHIGQQLKIPRLDDDEADVKKLVKARLSQESTGKWLMIIDNADKFEIFYNDDKRDKSSALSDYLPFSPLGSILFTTRDRKAATKYAAVNVVDVDEMDNTESMELFQRSLQDKTPIENKDGITKLLQLLVNLPLAIIQATAYLNANTCSIKEYLRIYEESNDNIIRLLSENFEEVRRYPDMKNPVATTWLISFDYIRVRDRLAADYMAFISCIKEQDIHRDLLPQASEFDKSEALGTLKAFGFIKERLSGTSYDMHRLVHMVMQNWLKHKDEWRSWNERTLKRIANIYPWPVHENRAVWMMCLPHASCIITSHETDFSASKNLAWSLLDKLGLSFHINGKYLEAMAMHQQALQLRLAVLGTDHPDTLMNMDNLANSLHMQGKYIVAEAMQRQTLQLKEIVLGKDHPDTLITKSNLADSLCQQGKYTEAETIHRHIVQLRETILRKDHPDTVRGINNLAISLHQQGKYTEAEIIYRQIVQLRERVLGKDHPDTLGSINNLADSLRQQGKYSEAQIMDKQTLQLQQTVIGRDHPDTLTSMNNLASSLQLQGNYREAEVMHQQTLQLRESVLGKDHPNTLESMNNLAISLHQQGKYREAEVMHQQRLQLEETVLTRDHPNTLGSMNNLASSLQLQGNYTEAEVMHRQTLQLRETVLGKDHPDTLGSMNNLADSLRQQGKYTEAEAMHRQTLQLMETVLGKDHPNTLKSMNNLAISLRQQGKYTEAEVMHRQTLQLRKIVLGKDHPQTLTSMNNLANSLYQQGKYTEAEAIHRQTLQLKETVLGKDHPSTLVSRNNLANSLYQQGKDAEAEAIQGRIGR